MSSINLLSLRSVSSSSCPGEGAAVFTEGFMPTVHFYAMWQAWWKGKLGWSLEARPDGGHNWTGLLLTAERRGGAWWRGLCSLPAHAVFAAEVTVVVWEDTRHWLNALSRLACVLETAPPVESALAPTALPAPQQEAAVIRSSHSSASSCSWASKRLRLLPHLTPKQRPPTASWGNTPSVSQKGAWTRVVRPTEAHQFLTEALNEVLLFLPPPP